MKIEFEGREWTLDTAHIRLKQAMAIQEQTGLSVQEWEDSLLERGEDKRFPVRWLTSMASLYWLMHEQSQDPVDYETADFDVSEFAVAYYDGLRAEVAKRKAEREEKVKPAPFPPAAPPSAGPLFPTDMTQVNGDRWAGTAYTRPAISPG